MSAPLQTIAAHPLREHRVDSREVRAVPRLAVREAPLLEPLSFLHSRQGLRFYAWLPEERLEVCGIGIAWETVAEGPERFNRVAAETARLFSGWNTHDAPGPWQRLWGGFAFAETVTSEWRGFPPARWFLPAFQYLRRDSEAWYVHAGPNALHADGPLSAAIHPDRVSLLLGDTPAQPERWDEKVRLALAEIGRPTGPDKIVLARRRTFTVSGEPALAELLGSLRSRQKTGVLMAVEGTPGRWFVTATPERLVSLADKRVTTHAVAGTIGASDDGAEDAQRRRQLLGSEKDLREHEWVVQSLSQSLEGLCSDFHRTPAPVLLSLPTVHHLVTPVEARTRPGVGLFDIAAALHPTAAVGGYPRRQAEAWLRTHEDFNRGWYAGPVGYVGPDGNGSLFVAIRSGLLTPETLTLYAGAGLVTGSDPGKEWNETEDKIRTLLDVLGGEL